MLKTKASIRLQNRLQASIIIYIVHPILTAAKVKPTVQTNTQGSSCHYRIHTMSRRKILENNVE